MSVSSQCNSDVTNLSLSRRSTLMDLNHGCTDGLGLLLSGVASAQVLQNTRMHHTSNYSISQNLAGKILTLLYHYESNDAGLPAKALSVSAPSVWNKLSYNCRYNKYFSTFTRILKTELFDVLILK